MAYGDALDESALQTRDRFATNPRPRRHVLLAEAAGAANVSHHPTDLIVVAHRRRMTVADWLGLMRAGGGAAGASPRIIGGAHSRATPGRAGRRRAPHRVSSADHRAVQHEVPR